MHRCPICNAQARAYPDNPYAPFCSERCKLIDLGKWLGEEYRIESTSPLVPDDIDDGGSASS